jgi:hypothetical protein
VCPAIEALVADTKRPSSFIECANDTGIATRHQCQPRGTVFDSESQTCKKPVLIEPFTISAMRIIIRFLVNTKYSFAPWIKVVSLNATDSRRNESNNKSLMENKSSTSENISLTIIDPIDDFEGEDQMETFSDKTYHIVFYYAVLYGIPLFTVICFLVTSCILTKIFWRRNASKDDGLRGEFYRYNQHDTYIMTRM